jgi:hypothetical protein
LIGPAGRQSFFTLKGWPPPLGRDGAPAGGYEENPNTLAFIDCMGI